MSTLHPNRVSHELAVPPPKGTPPSSAIGLEEEYDAAGWDEEAYDVGPARAIIRGQRRPDKVSLRGPAAFNSIARKGGMVGGKGRTVGAG
jgi:hypothetical protein